MQSLADFSLVQQEVEAASADSQAVCSTASPPNCYSPGPVKGQDPLRAALPRTPHSCVKLPESQQDTSPSTFHPFSCAQPKTEQNEKAGKKHGNVENRALVLQE